MIVSSFSSPPYYRRRHVAPARPQTSPSPAITTLGAAMERLHDPSTSHSGSSAEHVYSLKEIDAITRKIVDDEWTALGSAIAETMYEMILDLGDDALQQRGWADRMGLTDKIAEEVSSGVEKSLRKFRSQPLRTNRLRRQSSHVAHHDRDGPHHHALLPRELLDSLQALLRHELGRIVVVVRDVEDASSSSSSFDYNDHHRDLSPLVLSFASTAVESYCGMANVDAPFFDLEREMERRVRDRRRELLLRHSRGYEGVVDVEEDIERSRREWTREVLGTKAAAGYEFGEVITRDGNGHSHRKERRAREGRRSNILNALFQDLDGILMP